MPTQLPPADPSAAPPQQVPPQQVPLRQGDVLADVRTILAGVMGAGEILESHIDMGTSFGNDLCLESLQFVILAEQLRARYGEKVDFVAWLAGMDLDGIIALTVGQLVDFIMESGRESARGGADDG
ncbi:MAG: acyl carrier protein [Acidimicrobiales bacterium]